ncbi:MAG: right-handed parallel beta-helix repeat-containing protein, partial [Armatimonadota bacterium]
AAIDDEHGAVSLRGSTAPDPRLIDWAGGRYYVENLFEGLDSPGEWYLDRPTGILYYKPRPGESMDEIDAVMPLVERLVEFRGDAEAGERVSHIALRGLTFEHASWPMPERGWNERQAQSSMETAAIYARGAEHCVLEDIEVRHVGAHGVWFERGCRHNRLERCHVWDVGAGGVYLGATTETPEASHNVVHNCYVHHCTEVHGGAIGVWIGRSSYNEVSRCEIADMNYSGMSVGWSWGYAQSSAHHNIIADNHIHHCGHRVLSDMGGIYTLGVAPGTELRHNLIHDIWCYPAYSHASGIYLDEGSTGLLVTDNIVYRCTSNGFLLHYGRESAIRNNIFAYAERNGVHRARAEEHISFFFERNIVLSAHPDVLGGRWDDAQHYVMDRNLYWCTSGEPVLFGGRTLQRWRELGNDVHSIIANPDFRAPERGDFTLAEDSPASRIGFEPISMEGIGLYGDRAWVSLPQRFEQRPDDPLPPEPEPLTISEGFETVPGTDEPAPLGGHPLYALVHTEERPELVGITDEVAASGTRSLRVQDADDLQREFNPHFYYRPAYTEGVARCSFDICVDAATVFYHEWRDAASPYRVGPSLRIEHGVLSAQGVEAIDLPTDAWVRIEVKAALGEDAGAWQLAVTVPDGTVQRFDGLAVVSPGWRELHWLGFVSNGREPATWYIDNIGLRRAE